MRNTLFFIQKTYFMPICIFYFPNVRREIVKKKCHARGFNLGVKRLQLYTQWFSVWRDSCIVIILSNQSFLTRYIFSFISLIWVFFSKGIMLHRLCNKHLLNRFRHHRYRYWEKWKWCQQNRDWYTCILVCRRYCCYYHHKIVFSKSKAYLVKGNQFIPQGEIIFQLTF